MLDAIEAINPKTEESTVWAEYAAKAHEGLEIAADVAEGLAGLGALVVIMNAGIKFLRGEPDDEKTENISDDNPESHVIAIQVIIGKVQPKAPLAEGIKTAEEMGKAMRKLAKPLARIAQLV